MRVDPLVRFRGLIFDPNGVAIVFWSGGIAAGVLALAFTIAKHNSSWQVIATLACLVVIAVAIVGVRLALGARIPPWFDQLNMGIATILISAGAAIDPSTHIDFADLYVWIALYAALYFRRVVATLQIAGAGAAYAFVLAIGSNVENPLAAWLTTFGTVSVLAVIVTGLVGKLRDSSLEDALTHLANRRYWDERVVEEMERARREGTSLSLVLIDIDDFKDVNDRYGHQAGDRLLCQFAEGWQGTIRGSGDFVARLGGDEFGLLAPNTDERGIDLMTQRLHEVSPDGISCSYGVATWDGHETVTDFFRRADDALYQAKRS
jgi:diguanylate cyclase (GGDEF)-like protein